MCTRNGSRFVAQQVRSILDQTPAPIELVIGDDASDDDTVAVIEATAARFRAEHPHSVTAVRIHRRESPLGVARNFEATIADCIGPVIALSDQDDVWPEGRLARLVPLFRDASVLLVHTDARLIDEHGAASGALLLDTLEASAQERAALQTGDAFGVLLRRNLVTGATVVVRRSLAERAMPFPSSWLHDEWLAVMAAAEGGLRFVPEPWLDYRQHADNVVGASEVTWARRWARLREPRDERSERLVARGRSLVERLEQRSEATLLKLARAKLAHETLRSRLPRWQPLRAPGILIGVLAGRYARFSRGAIDVLRDLVQPATRSGRR
jgi:glycosyltransferase involved in cell wall biosynthesis